MILWLAYEYYHSYFLKNDYTFKSTIETYERNNNEDCSSNTSSRQNKFYFFLLTTRKYDSQVNRTKQENWLIEIKWFIERT